MNLRSQRHRRCCCLIGPSRSEFAQCLKKRRPLDLQLPEGTLLEGIVTTLNEDGSPHITPMGPIVDASFSQILLRPYRTSTTYQNLKRTGQGVLHVTDDVEMFARAAVGQLNTNASLVCLESRGGRDSGGYVSLACVPR